MATPKKTKAPVEYSVCGIPLVEVPRRKFLCGKTPVTRAQWARVMGTDAPSEADANLPMDGLSGADCWRFVEKLNATPEAAQLGVTFAIPTIDDWKFACLGSKKVTAPILDCGWFSQNSEDELHPVAQKTANGYGLYDFAGSVAELCSDGKGHGGDYRTDPVHYGPGLNGASLWAGCSSFGFRVFGFRNMVGNWWDWISKELWVLIFNDLPTVAGKCERWHLFESRDWAQILSEQPSLAEHCAWGELEWDDWCHLLAEQPQFADKCHKWAEFRNYPLISLLRAQPQFADRCNLSSLDDGDWEVILRDQPSLAAMKSEMG